LGRASSTRSTVSRDAVHGGLRHRPLDDRTGEVEVPDVGSLGMKGGRAIESSETAGKGKQRIENGFFHSDGFVVN
jgi:hypothetical protein